MAGKLFIYNLNMFKEHKEQFVKKIKKHLIKIVLLTLFVIVGYGYLSSQLQVKVEDQSYTEFKTALEAGEVKEVVILLDATDFKYVNQDDA